MHISVLSGKGGTGKTTIAVNLASVLNYHYVDCDVEAPNGFLFLKPQTNKKEEVQLLVPKIDEERCTLCWRCVEHCQFNALVGGGNKVLLLEKLCHSCGLCSLVCPAEAIAEVPRPIGYVEDGQQGGIACWQGVLTTGEPMGAPIIDALKDKLGSGPCILDAPPGSSCSVVATAIDTDFALLVTEPTPFGVHDLQMVKKVVDKLEIPAAIIINRSHGDDGIVEDYAAAAGLPVIGSLPFSLQAAAAVSRGDLLSGQPLWHARFLEIGLKLKELMACNS